MEYEKLTCIECNATWKRQKARGRKPKLCPSCLTQPEPVHKQEQTSTKTKFKPNLKWMCHSCGVSVKTYIALDEAPTHSCSKRLKKVFPLEIVE